MDIISADMAGCGIGLFRHPVTNDQHVFINHPRRRTGNIQIADIAAQVVMKIDPAMFAEGIDQLSLRRIETIQK